MSKQGGINRVRFNEALARRQKILDLFPVMPSLAATLREVGISDNTYRNYREKYPDFAKEVDYLLELKKLGTFDPDQRKWQQGFAAFRKKFFGFDTPRFQHEIVQAYEETPPGNITMILLPPEHGKTSLFEDYATYALGMDPSFRLTVGCETSALSKKILGRVRNRMDPMGPSPEYVAWFGPFAPQTKQQGATEIRTSKQPWSNDLFNVYKKGDHDERDYSMVALGMNSQVAGTRTDHLHADDVTSLRNIGQTPKLVDIFRQDWLSRPGERGRTTVNGTRVDEDDFYEILEEQIPPDILRVIRMPAIVYDANINGYRPLWPFDPNTGHGYTMEMLERQRAKVGEDAWARNYMQQPRTKTMKTFTQQVVEPCMNPLRSILHDPPKDARIAIGLDPSIGGNNAFVVCRLEANRLSLLWIDERTDLTSNDAIMNVLEELCHQFTTTGARISDVIIETMAFQKGLAQDQRLLRIQKRFGFQVREHLTGWNKYDENIGIPSMVTNFLREEIDLPWAPHGGTRTMVEEFVRQLYAWKPGKRGTVLRQDQVMAFWFVWILWREQVRRFEVEKTHLEIPGARALPWSPTTFKPTTLAWSGR